MIRVGSWSLATVRAENFRLDGGAMFGVVPKPLWSRAHPADERNRIEMVTRCLLVRGEGRVVLVDTGMGGEWSDKERDIYAIENGRRSIVASLASEGVSPADVTDVVLTHLHFDHAGGATTRSDGRVAAAFPNARYHVQESQLRWALSPTEKDRRSYRPDDFVPLERDGRLRLVRGGAEILPGIHVEPTQGHTIGHQIVRVGEGRGAVVYCGDLIPTAAHLPIPWVMGYDLHPLTTMDEKRDLLARAVAEQWLLVLEHDPVHAAVRVRHDGEGFASAGAVEGFS
ncbi:MAG TPA: MBL fold metallo-hydrolase [Candidatus Polarisedimenticolia bacterium]|jgi:glyoxylase-like metal-dependent hydrolase (beta-lactamase superfamily II)